MSGAVAAVADTAANCVGDVQDCKRRISYSRKLRAQAGQDEKAEIDLDGEPQSTGGAIAQLGQELAVETATGKKSHGFRTKYRFH